MNTQGYCVFLFNELIPVIRIRDIGYEMGFSSLWATVQKKHQKKSKNKIHKIGSNRNIQN